MARSGFVNAKVRLNHRDAMPNSTGWGWNNFQSQRHYKTSPDQASSSPRAKAETTHRCRSDSWHNKCASDAFSGISSRHYLSSGVHYSCHENSWNPRTDWPDSWYALTAFSNKSLKSRSRAPEENITKSHTEVGGNYLARLYQAWQEPLDKSRDYMPGHRNITTNSPNLTLTVEPPRNQELNGRLLN